MWCLSVRLVTTTRNGSTHIKLERLLPLVVGQLALSLLVDQVMAITTLTINPIHGWQLILELAVNYVLLISVLNTMASLVVFSVIGNSKDQMTAHHG